MLSRLDLFTEIVKATPRKKMLEKSYYPNNNITQPGKKKNGDAEAHGELGGPGRQATAPEFYL